jgi:hypothetical protein
LVNCGVDKPLPDKQLAGQLAKPGGVLDALHAIYASRLARLPAHISPHPRLRPLLPNSKPGLFDKRNDLNPIATMTTSTPNEPIVFTSPPAKRIKTDTSAPTASETMASSSPPALLIKKLSDKARLPTRGSAFAAGYDLFAARATTIPARGKALVDTDISMSLPAGTCKYQLASSPDIVPRLDNIQNKH